MAVTCDPNLLVTQACNFRCLPPRILMEVKTSLLCSWSNAMGAFAKLVFSVSQSVDTDPGAQKTLIAKVIPANTLAKDGDQFKILVVWSGTTGTSFTFSLGGVVIVTLNDASAAGGKYVRFFGCRVNSTTLKIQYFDISGGQASMVTITVDMTT